MPCLSLRHIHAVRASHKALRRNARAATQTSVVQTPAAAPSLNVRHEPQPVTPQASPAVATFSLNTINVRHEPAAPFVQTAPIAPVAPTISNISTTPATPVASVAPVTPPITSTILATPAIKKAPNKPAKKPKSSKRAAVKPNSSLGLPKKRLFCTRRLRRADLINAESRIGSTIFGPIPAGHRREFFHDQKNIWIWHEDWTDVTLRHRQITVRYEVRRTGVYKKISAGNYFKLEGDELANFCKAARVYLQLVKTKLYNQSPVITASTAAR